MSDDSTIKTARLAYDMTDLIQTGIFDSTQLAHIETACRTQRVTLGPAKRQRGGESGRKRKRLRKLTAEEVSEQLAAYAGVATRSKPGYVAPTTTEDANYSAFIRDFNPNDDQVYRNDICFDGRWFRSHTIHLRCGGKKFTLGSGGGNLTGSQFKVVKINRTRARCELLNYDGSGTGSTYNIPLQLLLQSYKEGKFQP